MNMVRAHRCMHDMDIVTQDGRPMGQSKQIAPPDSDRFAAGQITTIDFPFSAQDMAMEGGKLYDLLPELDPQDQNGTKIWPDDGNRLPGTRKS